ncbi:uncharacterized protein G2W53_011474 [Senna tora]|uniref:Uncharacterized protein n=1 Tax=Senna tora TaxID=362788 RepID=A0A834X1D1_9FABA|nr:uncharacterized protein G2W53_011474 [Senna tora]
MEFGAKAFVRGDWRSLDSYEEIGGKANILQFYETKETVGQNNVYIMGHLDRES